MSGSSSFLPSPSGKHANPLSSLFASPKLFMGFPSKGFSDSEASMSPTSILEIKPFSLTNPNNHKKAFWGINGDSTAIGLGIIDSLTKEKPEKKSLSQSSRMVLFGSHLKIQIPSAQPNSISPFESPVEFGIKNKNSSSSSSSSSSSFTSREMELSEDYTCVISHGPNPKKTHIFDNCILESIGDGFVAQKKDRRCLTEVVSSCQASGDFLSFCHGCRKSLAQGKDIFMYRGERAFCSHECRQQEMISDAEKNGSCFGEL